MTVTPLNIKDGNNNAQTLATQAVSSNLQPIHCIADVNGNVVGTGANSNYSCLATFSNIIPATNGGSTYYNATLTSTVSQIKSSLGTLAQIDAYNPQATGTYLFIWFLPSSSVTLGTTTPGYQVFIPATTARNITFQFPIGGNGGSGLSAASYSTAGGTAGSSESIVFSAVFA
jgi:hypothetical protein